MDPSNQSSPKPSPSLKLWTPTSTSKATSRSAKSSSPCRPWPGGPCLAFEKWDSRKPSLESPGLKSQTWGTCPKGHDLPHFEEISQTPLPQFPSVVQIGFAFLPCLHGSQRQSLYLPQYASKQSVRQVARHSGTQKPACGGPRPWATFAPSLWESRDARRDLGKRPSELCALSCECNHVCTFRKGAGNCNPGDLSKYFLRNIKIFA